MAAKLTGALMPRRDEAGATHITSKVDEDVKMNAAAWYGKKDIRVIQVPRPRVTDPTDVIVKITSAAICGSDLHMYRGEMVGMKSGDVLGHENMGIVVEKGSEVKSLEVGNKVVVAFDLACGHCVFCKKDLFSGCDETNASKEQEVMYGHRTAGLLGYSHLTGGYAGGQAEYLRVPLADVNCIKVPQDIPDEKVLFISDILSTGWHGCELGKVGQGDNVAVYGAGPVGLLTALCANVRGAAKVVIVDPLQYRLDFAKQRFPWIETINSGEVSSVKALHEMFPETKGPDVAVDAVGLQPPQTIVHKVEQAVGLETDNPEVLNDIILATRKGGRLSVTGVYAAYMNHLNFGALMEKGLSLGAGQTPVQKYWKLLLDMVVSGKIDPSVVITHQLPLSEAARGYKIFNDKQEGCVKVVLKPQMEAMSTSEQ